MNWQRTLFVGVGGGAIAVWLAAAATSSPTPDRARYAETSAPMEARGAELAAEVARLRERLRPTATPLQRRDLFNYRRGNPAASTSPESAAHSAAVDLAATLVAVLPQFTLVGLAEDAGADGPVRTAIISGDGELFVVKEGDAVTSRYRVAKISADVVELTHSGAGTPLRLALP
jgi:hypothetical protein